jgi:hypothetical protein
MDVLGAAYYDFTPRFPVPAGWLKELATPNKPSPYLKPLLLSLRKQHSVAYQEIATALERICHIAAHLNRNSHDHRFWNDGVKASEMIGSLSHYLLSLPKLSQGLSAAHFDSDQYLLEIVRLAILVLLARLKIAFALVGTEFARLRHKLCTTLSHRPAYAMAFQDIYLWSLIVVTLCTTNDTSMPESLLQEIHRTKAQMSLRTSEEVVEVAKNIVWISAIFDAEVPHFCEVVDNGNGNIGQHAR